MTAHDIQPINAALNGLATVLITAGFILIKAGKKEAHRAVMLTAAVVSALFRRLPHLPRHDARLPHAVRRHGRDPHGLSRDPLDAHPARRADRVSRAAHV